MKLNLFWISVLCGVGTVVSLCSCSRMPNDYEREWKWDDHPSEPPPGLALLPYYAEVAGEWTQVDDSRSVDILMSVDNSPSMNPFIEAVEKNLLVFTSALKDAGVDFQAGVVKSNNDDSGFLYTLRGPYPIVSSAMSDPGVKLGADLAAVRATPQGSSERPVTSLEQGGQEALNAGLFRKNTGRVFMVMSDSEDSFSETDIGQLTDYYYRALMQVAGANRWKLIVVGNPVGVNCPEAESQQPVLEALVKRSGGLFLSVCDQNYAGLLKQAADAAVGLLSEFPLGEFYTDQGSVDPDSVKVWLRSQAVPMDPVNGFTLNADATTVVFHGTFIPQAREKIEVEFEIKVP